MPNLPRRRFLKTIGGAAVATALPQIILGVQSQKRSVAVFWEPEFRQVNGCDISRETLQTALESFTVEFLGERDLIAQLDSARFDLLVTPYGSAFPKRIWPALLKYLRAGGNWLNIGGVPLANPVVRDGSRWVVEPAQTTFHKRLGITHHFPVDTPKDVNQIGFKTDKVFELYVRLSSTNNEPDEAGSDGPHEGVVQPMTTMVNSDGRAVGAPAIQIDRLLGEFAGGRWVFANFNGNIESSGISILAQRASQGASRFEVRTNFACYKPGEIPTLTVELLRPKGDLQKFMTTMECSIQIRDKTNAVVSQFNVIANADNSKATISVKIPDAPKLPPGFYKIEVQSTFNLLTYRTGFWVYDEELLARGKALTVDKHFFYRDAKVFPVTGTTYMASDKHRRFLFEPNPFVWDLDFWLMKDAGVNMVRTGIWTGWKKYMPEPGKVDVAETEAITIGTREYLVRYESEKMQRLEKAVVERPVRPIVYEEENGGKLVWSTLPLELGDSMPALVAFYRLALAEARVAPVFTALPQTPGVLILPSVFRDVVLYTFVSEIDRDTRMQVTHLATRSRFTAMVRAQRTAMVLIDRKTGRVLATDERG